MADGDRRAPLDRLNPLATVLTELPAARGDIDNAEGMGRKGGENEVPMALKLMADKVVISWRWRSAQVPTSMTSARFGATFPLTDIFIFTHKHCSLSERSLPWFKIYEA